MYNPNNYWLVRAETNAMNIYVVLDMKDNLFNAIVVDWDLSEDEEKLLIDIFNSGRLDFFENGKKWEMEEDAFKGTFNREVLA